MTIVIKLTYSLHYYTLHLSYIRYSGVSRFELTQNAFNWSGFRSAIHQLTSMSTSVRLFSLSFFFLCPPFLKVFQAYIGRERGRGSNTKEIQSKKNERESIQYKKKEGNRVDKKMKNGMLERRERTWVLRYSDKTRFLWKIFTFACSACTLISVSERCTIRCYFEQEH